MTPQPKHPARKVRAVLRVVSNAQPAPSRHSRLAPDPHGTLVLPPGPQGAEPIAPRARLALLLHRAVGRSYLLGDAVAPFYRVLRGGDPQRMEQACRELEALSAELESTQAEPVAAFGEADLHYAGFAFKYLRETDYEALGFEPPAEPGAFTRLQARRAVAHLRRAREAA